MKNERISSILFSIIILTYMWSLMLFASKKSVTKVKESQKTLPYVYLGQKKINEGPRYKENVDSCVFGCRGLAVRTGVYGNEDGLVSSPAVAYAIANAILTSVFGEEDMSNQRPLDITLVNNKYWCVQGNFKPKTPNTTGGSPIIIIKKDDSQIQFLIHDK